MATYVPNANQTAEPVESRTVESAALEFRTLKESINSRITAEESARIASDVLETAARLDGDTLEIAVRSAADTALHGEIDLILDTVNAATAVAVASAQGAEAAALALSTAVSVAAANTSTAFEAVGDGVTDDTAKIQAAITACQGALHILSDCYIAGDLTINGTLLVGPGRLIGPGTISGIVGNDTLPYDVIAIWNNIILASARSSPPDSTATFVVDPLFGVDTNSGSVIAPVKTLTSALAKTATLIASGASTSIYIALRSGRHELPSPATPGDGSVIMNATHTFTNDVGLTFANTTDYFELTDLRFSTGEPGVTTVPANVIVRNYIGETPTVCPPTTWFFRGVNHIDSYKGHDIVTNTYGGKFFSLFSGASGKEIPIASTWYKSGMRTQMNTSVGVAARPGGYYTLNFKPDVVTQTELEALTVDEIAQARFRLNHWWSSSWHSQEVVFDTATRLLYGMAYTNYSSYVNGWAVRFANGDPRARFFVENMKSCLQDENFCAYSTGVFLPNSGEVAFFTTSQDYVLIDSTLASNVIFTGIAFKYIYGSYIQQDVNYSQELDSIYVIKQGNNSAVRDCTFEYAHNGVLAGIYAGEVTRTKFATIGKYGINFRREGSHYIFVSNNTFKHIGSLDLIGSAMFLCGFGITVARNVVSHSTNGINTVGGMKLTSIAGGLSPAVVVYGEIYNNLVYNTGSFDEVKLDRRYQQDDSGAITCWTGGYKVGYNYSYNVTVNGMASGTRGFFGDDSINGATLYRNIFASSSDASISLRLTKNNYNTRVTYDNKIIENVLIGKAIIATYDAENDTALAVATTGYLDNTHVLDGIAWNRQADPYFFGGTLVADGANIATKIAEYLSKATTITGNTFIGYSTLGADLGSNCVYSANIFGYDTVLPHATVPVSGPLTTANYDPTKKADSVGNQIRYAPGTIPATILNKLTDRQLQHLNCMYL